MVWLWRTTSFLYRVRLYFFYVLRGLVYFADYMKMLEVCEEVCSAVG